MAESTTALAIETYVQAVSGGTIMMVAEVYPPAYRYRYRCTWTDEHGIPQHDLFRGEQLVRVNSPDPDTKQHAPLPDDETKERPPV